MHEIGSHGIEEAIMFRELHENQQVGNCWIAQESLKRSLWSGAGKMASLQDNL